MLRVKAGHTLELYEPASNLDLTTAEGAGRAAVSTALAAIDAPSAATVEQQEVKPRPIPESSLLKVDLVSRRGSRGSFRSRNRCGIHG